MEVKYLFHFLDSSFTLFIQNDSIPFIIARTERTLQSRQKRDSPQQCEAVNASLAMTSSLWQPL